MDADALRVLVIDDDKALAEALGETLSRRGHAVTVATSGKVGAAKLDSEEYDVVLTDLKMAEVDGLAIVKQVREKLPEAEVYVITGYGDVKTAVEAMKLGATHYLLKPVDMVELRTIVEKAGERTKLAKTNRDLRQQLDEKFGYEGVIGNGTKMRQVLRLLKAYAPTNASVLILGENGTGKELAAKALHVNSHRKTKPYVALNCAALNENLLDDELFGHVPGSFTGGDKLRKGRFEFAHGGTLFLDEVGDMPLSLQAKLLRVLENGEVVRIGANESIKVDVRVIAATNKNLEEDVEAGRFRRDLYYRLRVGVIKLPPLRERKEDIPLLIEHFLKDLGPKHGKVIKSVSEPVRTWMIAQTWPGNVRELRHILESMTALDFDGILGLDDLPPDEAASADELLSQAPSERASIDPLLGKPLEEVERYYMLQMLAICNNNREEAAKRLGIGERTLYRKIKDWQAE